MNTTQVTTQKGMVAVQQLIEMDPNDLEGNLSKMINVAIAQSLPANATAEEAKATIRRFMRRRNIMPDSWLGGICQEFIERYADLALAKKP